MKDFMSEAKRIHREEGISMTAAMKRLTVEEPELYERFRQQEAARSVRTPIGKGGGARVTL